MYKNAIPADVFTRRTERIKPIYRMNLEENKTEQKEEISTAALEQELAAERERYLRLAADFDNYRKRVSREQEHRSASQKDALVRDILPAVDNLERVLSAKAGEDLREGVKLTYHQIIAVLKRHGFEPREDFGQPFDGRFHDGIAVGCRPNMPDLSVMEVWERGWMRGTELFRPAKVLVNRLQVNAATAGEADENNHRRCSEDSKIREAVLQ